MKLVANHPLFCNQIRSPPPPTQLRADLCRLQVLNEVVLEMSEEGSEQHDLPQGAEAALKLTFNRPFSFAVMEGNSGAVLLLGRIGNPAN